MIVADKVIMSGAFTTNQVSQAVPIDQMFGFCIQIAYGGTAPVGVLTVQGTNDDAQNVLVTPVWSDEASPVAIAGSGNVLLNFDHRYYRFFRLALTVTSGTITIVARFNDKGP